MYRHYIEFNLAHPEEQVQFILTSKVWYFLHGAATRHEPHIPFAVAFPGWKRQSDHQDRTLGDTMRVFFKNRDAAEKMVAELQERADVQISIHDVRTDQIKGYEAFLMRRIPASRNSRIHEQRLKQQRDLPFAHMESITTKNKFKLVVDRVAVNGNESGKPNGYGLSRITQIVPVPVIQ